MQELTVTIPANWTLLSSLITVDASKTYRIQNRSQGILVAAEGTTTPTNEGDYIDSLKTAVYKKGSQDLYLKGHTCAVNVNITSEG